MATAVDLGYGCGKKDAETALRKHNITAQTNCSFLLPLFWESSLAVAETETPPMTIYYVMTVFGDNSIELSHEWGRQIERF